jgi:hypothetical protein
MKIKVQWENKRERREYSRKKGNWGWQQNEERLITTENYALVVVVVVGGDQCI